MNNVTFSIFARWQVADPASLPTVPFVVVSIQDPAADEVVVATSPLCHGILRLAFDDVDGDYPGDSVVRMTTQHAQRAWAFAQAHLAGIAAIVCQCEHGLSRSAGMAIGLANALGIDHSWIASPKYAPNQYVARMVQQAATRSLGGWRAALGCAPASPGSPPPEDRIRAFRDADN